MIPQCCSQLYFSSILDVYIEEQRAQCAPRSEMLAEAKTTLIEAKYLCSIDPTCIHFYMQLSGYDKGMYFKCSFGAKIDYSYPGYILYTKGEQKILLTGFLIIQVRKPQEYSSIYSKCFH